MLAFTYDDRVPWPTAPDGLGFSLTLIAPKAGLDLNDPRNWRSSVASGGTPGGGDRIDYASWATAAGIAGAAELGDEEPDGVSNLIEYGMGLAPLADSSRFLPAGGVRSVEVDDVVGDYFVVSFRRNKAADDVVLEAQVSDDLGAADWEVMSEVVEIVDNFDGTETVVVRTDAPIGDVRRRFVRVVVRRG